MCFREGSVIVLVDVGVVVGVVAGRLSGVAIRRGALLTARPISKTPSNPALLVIQQDESNRT